MDLSPVGGTQVAGTNDRHPTWVDPMLATLTDRRFSDPDWIFERKLDGVRALAVMTAGTTRIWSRAHNDVTASYPELAAALDDATGVDDFIVDGEIVAFDGDRTSFERLQRRIHQTDAIKVKYSGVPVYFYAFDLVRFDGHDVTPLGLRERKALLAEALDFADPLRMSEHREESGEEMFAYACAHGWEGVIAKKASSRYRPGRSRDWLKMKCIREQEVVVGGFTPPAGSRSDLGALLVGVHDATGLRYAGKVGTGFSEATLRMLRERLDPLARTTSPFVDDPQEKGARWVEPTLVAQVRFAEWTSTGRLRHPSFVGLRTDKPAGDVVREGPGA